MTDLLSHQVRMLEAAASVVCTQCLRDEIAEDAEALPELIERLEQAAAKRDGTPDGEADYHAAHAKVMVNVLALAVFTAELTRRPPELLVLDLKASAN